MPLQRTHIEPSACVCILSLLKRIVPSIVLNIMVGRVSLLSCAVVVVVVVVVIKKEFSRVG